MITAQEYEELLPYRGAIFGRSGGGATGAELAALYGQHGRYVNMTCPSCVAVMLNYFTEVMMEYEAATPPPRLAAQLVAMAFPKQYPPEPEGRKHRKRK